MKQMEQFSKKLYVSPCFELQTLVQDIILTSTLDNTKGGWNNSPWGVE